MEKKRHSLRWIVIGLLVAIGAVIIIPPFLQPSPKESSARAQREVQETVRNLQAEGFKTDLSEFNLSVPSGSRNFEFAIAAFRGLSAGGPHPPLPDLMTPVAPDAAIVLWNQDMLEAGEDELGWADLKAQLDDLARPLDTLRAPALSEPIQFDLTPSDGHTMILSHLGPVRTAVAALDAEMLLRLHQGDRDAAWTNLLASTRIVTAWQTEPAAMSYMVRFSLVEKVSDATWQALQCGQWPEDRLAALQEQWESCDLLGQLPEVEAFERAASRQQCVQERAFPHETDYFFSKNYLKIFLHSPKSAWRIFKARQEQISYAKVGTYEDEKAVLLFYKERELEMRHAVQAGSWLEMQQLPGVTNTPAFVSKYQSRMSMISNLQQVRAHFLAHTGVTFLGEAAQAEARRRVIVTAIALERYRQKNGAYPTTLEQLTPAWLKQPAMDFIDGKPLHYRLTSDGHFVLYSLGLDGVDEGGDMRVPNRERGLAGLLVDPADNGNLVWPRPATAAQTESLHKERLNQEWSQDDLAEEQAAQAQWALSILRQKNVDQLLAKPTLRGLDAISFEGRPLSEFLRNATSAGTNKLSLTEMLTLRPVITGQEPECMTFEVPINYDALNGAGHLGLYIDPGPSGGDSDEGPAAQQMECNRATNGNCLVVWHTIFESPGRHGLLLGIEMDDPALAHSDISGPPLAVSVTNLCQFSLSSATFDVKGRSSFRAHLPEANASYTAEILTTNGVHLKTIPGNTTTGLIHETWDLVGEDGNRFQGESFNSVWHITLTDSGRSQTLKGP